MFYDRLLCSLLLLLFALAPACPGLLQFVAALLQLINYLGPVRLLLLPACHCLSFCLLRQPAACNFLRILTLHCQCNWQALAACHWRWWWRWRWRWRCRWPWSCSYGTLRRCHQLQQLLKCSYNFYADGRAIYWSSQPNASGYFHKFIFIIMNPTIITIIIVITLLTLGLMLQKNNNTKEIDQHANQICILKYQLPVIK